MPESGIRLTHSATCALFNSTTADRWHRDPVDDVPQRTLRRLGGSPFFAEGLQAASPLRDTRCSIRCARSSTGSRCQRSAMVAQRTGGRMSAESRSLACLRGDSMSPKSGPGRARDGSARRRPTSIRKCRNSRGRLLIGPVRADSQLEGGQSWPQLAF